MIKLYGAILAFLLIITAGVVLYSGKNQEKIVVNLMNKPHSADPYEYDHMVHHAVFPSVLGTLVSVGQTGKYQGLIAENWTVSNDYQTWRFAIRKGLRFSDGQEITADSVLPSFKRIILLQKKSKSQSGLVSIVEGVDLIKTIKEDFPGLKVEHNEIVFILKKPTPDFLDIISFGLYGIVSLNDFDDKTLEWKDLKEVTSSNGYKLVSWTDKSILIQLRNDFNLNNEQIKKASSVEFIWSGERVGDIFPRTSITAPDIAKPEDYVFHGPTPTGITFIRLASYNNVSSFFNDKKNRKALRACFYARLESKGIKVSKNFVPLSSDIIKSDGDDTCQADFQKLKQITYAYPNDSKSISVFGLNLQKAFQETAEELNLSYEYQQKYSFAELIKNMDGSAPDFDFFNMGSYVRAEEPFEDVRFMFLSKEGIRLPDETGAILSEIKKDKFSLEMVNQLIWDQALIWPVAHFSYGFWGNKKLDFSKLNLLHPSLDFNVIGIAH